MHGTHELHIGDVMNELGRLPADSVQCVVTSPPYWGLRDYGVPGQLGLEATPEEHVEKMVAVFREVRRVLRSDGTLWLNYGDCYLSAQGGRQSAAGEMPIEGGRSTHAPWNGQRGDTDKVLCPRSAGLKAKDLVGMPWRVAFALQADGWWLRSDIIWAKPNPMPESVTDRPTKGHEYMFLMTKAARYFYDADAVREQESPNTASFRKMNEGFAKDMTRHEVVCEASRELREDGVNDRRTQAGLRRTGGDPGDRKRNLRTVWTIPTQRYPDAHFATFPEALPERCIKAGTRQGDTVLDPFAGSGTTLAVACQLGRNAIGIELSEEYAAMAERRIGAALRPSTYRPDTTSDAPLFD